MDTSSAPTFTVEALMAHASWARALARRLVADPDAAEELVQETLLAGWKHPPAQDGPVRPWLATVLRNLARSRRRGETRARRRHQAWHDDVAPAASPEEALAGLQAQQRLAGMLARLSEPYRHTVYLRYVEGGTAADIARAQGVPEGTVRWRIKTALDQLRRWYSEEEGPDWRRALLPLSGGAGGVGVRPSRAVRAAKLATGVAVVAALLVVAPVLRRAVPVGGVSAVPEDPAVSRSVRLLPAASGVIQGRVLGPAGAPAAGAAVVLAGPAGAGPQVAGADGAFRFGDLAAGRYSITASAGSLLPGRAQVQLAEGGSASAELQLSAGGAQLRGQVLDAAAGVIPSARVEVESDHEDAPRPVLLANEQGRFAVQLPLGGYWVSVRADGYARETTRVELAGDQAHDFFLQPAAVLAGQVVDGEGGDPVPDAFVRADPVDGGHGRDTRSGRDGSFRLGDLQPGRYRVFARKGTWVGFAAGPVVVAVAGAVDGISIPLSSSFSLTGRVLDPAGNPQAGARVGLQEARGAGYGFFEKEVKATTDAQGRYRIEGLVPGVYQLSAHARPFGDAEDVTAGLVDGDQSVPDLRLGPAARVEGQVLAADGKPAAGLEVQLEVRTADDGNALYRGRGSRHTDAQGRFGVDDLGAGWLTATATGPRGDSVSRKVALLAGQSTRVELRFAAPGFVQGRVRWTDGAPAAGVHVVWSEDDSRAATDADGRYRLGPLAPGESSVQAERPGTTSQRSGTGERDPSERWVEVRPGQTVESVDLVLSRGDQTIAGVVLDPEGSPVGGATLEAEPTGTTPARSWVRTRVVTGADGRFTIPALTRGQHRVRATDPRFPPAEVEAAGGSGKVRLRFAAAASVAGTLSDPAGHPVAVANVRVVPAETLGRTAWTFGKAEGSERVIRDRSGHFAVGPLAAGTYDLLVTTPSGGAARIGAIPLAAGEKREGLQLVVRGSLTVEGRVLAFDSGEPIAQATVGIAGEGAYIHSRTDEAGVFRLERQVPGRVLYLQINGPGSYGGDLWEVVLASEGTRERLPDVQLVRPAAVPRLPEGVRFSHQIGPLQALQVGPGSAFARAGVRPGDRLRTLGGRPAEGLGWGGVGLAIASLGGKASLVFVSPDGTERSVTVELAPPAR